jgi:beta-aspartyl-peptidase (threonine type)
MKNFLVTGNGLGCFFLAILFAAISLLHCSGPEKISSEPKYAIAIHGGAGTILKENMTPEMEEAYRSKLTEALTVGYEILKNGGGSLEAVEKAIVIMEDSPLFNAGKGAVFTHSGTNELDASVMDGKTLQAGAVAGVKHVKNPIKLAQLVMEKSPHVMLTGEGAEAFAKEQGLEMVSPDYFYTERRWQQLQRKKQREAEKENSPVQSQPQGKHGAAETEKVGTVGVVALDQQGNLAAGTSTGGMTNKRWGRVGDAPIIGAGTYADNRTCAISATGDGEYFIRLSVARDISALMAYKGLSVKEAADLVIHKKLTELGGTGGVIVLDKEGNIAMPFNTTGMYRGYVDRNGVMVVKIYKD